MPKLRSGQLWRVDRKVLIQNTADESCGGVAEQCCGPESTYRSAILSVGQSGHCSVHGNEAGGEESHQRHDENKLLGAFQDREDRESDSLCQEGDEQNLVSSACLVENPSPGGRESYRLDGWNEGDECDEKV